MWRDEKLQAKAEEVVRESEKPSDVTYVARKLGLTWPTARAILFELVAEKRLYALRTSSAWIFYAKRNQLETST